MTEKRRKPSTDGRTFWEMVFNFDEVIFEFYINISLWPAIVVAVVGTYWIFHQTLFLPEYTRMTLIGAGFVSLFFQIPLLRHGYFRLKALRLRGLQNKKAALQAVDELTPPKRLPKYRFEKKKK